MISAVQPKENFYTYLSLKTVLSALKLLKLLFNECRLPLSFSSHIPCLKDNLHNLKKYESKGTSKISISQMVSELEINWKCNLSWYSKIPIFNLFHELAKATFKNLNFQSFREFLIQVVLLKIRWVIYSRLATFQT